MVRKSKMIGTLIFIMSILLISGCGDKGAVEKIRDEIKNNNLSTAKQIYEDKIKDKSKVQKAEFNKELSKTLLVYLQDGYKKQKKDKEQLGSFYNDINNIEELGVKNTAFEKKLDSYKEETEAKINESSIYNTSENTEKQDTKSSLSGEDYVYVHRIDEYVNSYNDSMNVMKELLSQPVNSGSDWVSKLSNEEQNVKTKLLELVNMTVENKVPDKYKEAHSKIEATYTLLVNTFMKLDEATKAPNNQTLTKSAMDFLIQGRDSMKDAISTIEGTYSQ